ncbi:hypothetical protein FORC20_2619 [Salmonella enterica subsp. enterica serovar Typhimurium]|nr:hypothetical protein FORC20_2619 [Salmonella enterica subsp. enterica serovar Typhimurium]
MFLHSLKKRKDDEQKTYNSSSFIFYLNKNKELQHDDDA